MIAWYAVHTRAQAEATALEHLLRQGYDAYLPRYRAQVRHARRLKTVLRPLFPRYLFAGVDRDAARWRPILSTVGVSDLVRAGDEPIALAPEIVETLRRQEEAGALERLARRRPPRLGELVRVSAGAFEDMIGRLVDLRDEDRVIVLLDILGRKVRTLIEADAVEAA